MGRVHAGVLAKMEGVTLIGVSDLAADAAAEVAVSLGIESIGSEDLAGRNDVDAWLVATPTPTHGSIVSAGLDARVHVLCEKPLSLDRRESDRLASKASRVGRALQVGFWRRFSPPWVAAKRLIDRGAIGRPLYLRLAQWDADPPPSAFCDPSVSGGLAIDCGVHEFDLAEWLTGSAIERVSGHDLPIVENTIGAAGDVDNLVATLHFASGAVATVDLSRNCRFGDYVRTEILGEEGAIMIDSLPRGQTRLATRAGVETVEDSQTDDVLEAGLIAQTETFARLAAGEDVEYPGAAQSERAVRVGRAVQRASATGQMVELGG